MRQKRAAGTGGGEQTIRDIRRATGRRYSAEEKIRIVLDGRLLAPDCALTWSRMHRAAHSQSPTQIASRGLRSMPNCGIDSGAHLGNPG